MKKITIVVFLVFIAFSNICCAKTVPLSDHMTLDIFKTAHNNGHIDLNQPEYLIDEIINIEKNSFRGIVNGNDKIAVIFHTNDSNLITDYTVLVNQYYTVNGRNTQQMLIDMGCSIGIFFASRDNINEAESQENSQNIALDLAWAVHTDKKTSRYVRFMNRKYIIIPGKFDNYKTITICASDE